MTDSEFILNETKTSFHVEWVWYYVACWWAERMTMHRWKCDRMWKADMRWVCAIQENSTWITIGICNWIHFDTLFSTYHILFFEQISIHAIMPKCSAILSMLGQCTYMECSISNILRQCIRTARSSQGEWSLLNGNRLEFIVKLLYIFILLNKIKTNEIRPLLVKLNTHMIAEHLGKITKSDTIPFHPFYIVACNLVVDCTDFLELGQFDQLGYIQLLSVLESEF